MQTPRWSEVADFFGRTNGQPLGVYVFGAGVKDWEKAIAAVVSQGWQVGFTSIGRPDLPGVREIFAGADDLSASLSVQPLVGLFMTTRFSTADEIEFGLHSDDVRGQTGLDAVCTFLRVVAQAVGKPAVLTSEELRPRHLLAYDPGTDHFAVRPETPRTG
ncbi:hypothetical protein [Kribbella lupini]|uniref:Uncharacterized protein n=1 Tax=Kribbella lupini TaxID=291602 RepID=A0ABN2BXA7_9ACTN